MIHSSGGLPSSALMPGSSDIASLNAYAYSMSGGGRTNASSSGGGFVSGASKLKQPQRLEQVQQLRDEKVKGGRGLGRLRGVKESIAAFRHMRKEAIEDSPSVSANAPPAPPLPPADGIDNQSSIRHEDSVVVSSE